MGNPRQGGIGKNHKRRLVNFVCPLVSPRPQFTCKGRIWDFRRHCRFFRIGLFSIYPFCIDLFGIDLFLRANGFRLRLFLVFEILITRGEGKLLDRTIDVVHIRIHSLVLHENRRRYRRTQDEPLQSAATAERHVCLPRRKSSMHVNDSLVECKSLALMYGYGPCGLKRILLKPSYLLG